MKSTIGQSIHWLVSTQAGRFVRIVAGITFFGVLAIVDILRRGRQATRWREYAVLVVAVLIAMLYGAANDQITSRISWEYFYYGKELQGILGPDTPPEARKLSWQAVRIGAEATWTVGLLIGVALLLANNPRKNLPQLSFGRLLSRMWIIILCCISFAALLGAIGYRGGLVWMSDDFRQLVKTDLFRPYRFMAVYGVHIGGYVGGFIGMVWAVISIVVERRRFRGSSSPARSVP